MNWLERYHKEIEDDHGEPEQDSNIMVGCPYDYFDDFVPVNGTCGFSSCYTCWSSQVKNI